MSVVQFKDRFRERLPEWISSIALMFWGVILLGEAPELWDREYFSVLSHIATQKIWSFACILVGTIRVISLAINGAWRPTAHLRALGAGLGAILWAAILVSYMGLPWNPPSMSLYAAMIFTDVVALWFAAGDAKLSDIKAYRDKEVVKNGNGISKEIKALKAI